MYHLVPPGPSTSPSSAPGLASSALEALPQPVIIYDADSLAIAYANAAATTLYGWSLDELQQRTLRDLRPAEDPPALAARYGGGHWEHHRKDGSVLTVRIMSQQLPGTEHNLRVATISDETAFLAADIADAEGRQQERLAALRDLAGQAAHQGRNPLGSVVALAHCLLATPEVGDNPEARRDLSTIVTEAQRVASALHDLLTVTRAADPGWDPVQVARVVQRATSERVAAWNQMGIVLRQELDPHSPCVLVDRARLADMVRLIIGNAAHSMHGTGGELRVTLTTVNRQVVLTVEDEGPGLPEDLLRRLVNADDRVVDTSGEPTLVGAKAWARAAGGWFAADNSPTGGARITLTLPAVRLASDALVQSSAPDDPAPFTVGETDAAFRVLYLDENLARRSNACLDLGHDGRFAMAHASTGGLLGVLETDSSYDVVIADMDEPEHDGPELWGALDGRLSHVRNRILFVVGEGTSASARDFLAQTGRPWLQRPVTTGTLAALIEAIARSAPVRA